MKERTFEDMLKDIHSAVFPMLLDDDIPDHFDDWLGSLDGDEYITWADIFGKERFLAGMQHARDILDNKQIMNPILNCLTEGKCDGITQKDLVLYYAEMREKIFNELLTATKPNNTP